MIEKKKLRSIITRSKSSSVTSCIFT